VTHVTRASRQFGSIDNAVSKAFFAYNL